MFLSIAHYDAKRRGENREPNGRSRRVASVSEFVVYFVYVPETGRLKVGQTRDIKSRVRAFDWTVEGTPHCHAQLIVRNREEALALERHAIAALKADYPAISREWFDVPAEAVDEAIAAITKTAPVQVIGQRGAPGTQKPELSTADFAAKEVCENIRIARMRRRKAA